MWPGGCPAGWIEPVWVAHDPGVIWEDTVEAVSASVIDQGVVLDLCVPRVRTRRVGSGRWSLTCDSSQDGSWSLSRWMGQPELERNCGRIDGDGLCGYLALEWASRVGLHPGARALALREEGSPVVLARFLETLVVGVQGPLRSKFDAVIRHLRESAAPWCSPRADRLWLGVADFAGLVIAFPLVVWGSDSGGGWRSVMYPSGCCRDSDRACELVGVRAQIVLDRAHFHPVDGPDGSVEDLCASAGLSGSVVGCPRVEPAARVGEVVAGVGPAKRGAAFLGICATGERVFEAPSPVRVKGSGGTQGCSLDFDPPLVGDVISQAGPDYGCQVVGEPATMRGSLEEVPSGGRSSPGTDGRLAPLLTDGWPVYADPDPPD